MTNPYRDLPDHTRWNRAVARVAPEAFDPVTHFPFRIGRRTRVATAGSCFAQHIAQHLREAGYTVLVTEDGHPMGGEALKERFGYGVFPARFGNIYTARQLRQLFARAFGRFAPALEPWRTPEGGVLDPLRPTIQPDGFASERELELDRAQHLRAVRRMFETLEVFVFTLGLTEGWVDRASGAALPLCPGVAGGVFDPATVRFNNATATEVADDMAAFLRDLAAVNPGARVILTVSPVPLAATALDRHVAVSTSSSKASLRVACEELAARFGHVAYFPSYEVITSAPERYFAADRRSVTEAGVAHVMRLFFAHATDPEGMNTAPPTPADPGPAIGFEARMAEVVAVLCDESRLDAVG